MNVQIDIIVLLLSGLVVLVLGLFFGYRLAVTRLEDRFQDVAEKERTIQRRRVAMQRERYQESTSRIHRAQGEQESKNLILREELEQNKLELSILKQDMQLDLEVLRGDKESLEAEIGRLKGTAVSFTEVDHAEIPVIEGPEHDEDHQENLESIDEKVSADESELAPDVVSKTESDLEPPTDHDFEFPEVLDRDTNLDFERLSKDIRESEHDEPLEAGELSFHWTPRAAERNSSKKTQDSGNGSGVQVRQKTPQRPARKRICSPRCHPECWRTTRENRIRDKPSNSSEVQGCLHIYRETIGHVSGERSRAGNK